MVSSLKHEVERLKAAREIENLVNLYCYKLAAAQFSEIPEMFALDTPGVKVELLDTGVYDGAEAVRKLYLEVHQRFLYPSDGFLMIDYNASPVIEVAEDGKTAKGLWFTPTIGAMPDKDGKLEAVWFFQKRAMDFVKENGKWKIWHYHAYNILFSTFYKSWTDLPQADLSFGPPLPPDMQSNKPSTYHWYYDPKGALEYVPAAPEPYKTWDETFSY